LPTLAQLKELEDLRVQLTLPGADPQVEVPSDAEAEAPGASDEAAAGAASESDSLDASADDDDEQDSAGAQDSEGASPRPQGLVASGAHDDPN
jgi:hypothetical protein